MAKVYPAAAAVSNACSSSSMSSAGRKSFTIWMKSLVCHTNGCTVFDSKGHIVYRVENYDTRGSSEVHLMDLSGQILFTILKKKVDVVGCWNGYKGMLSGGKKGSPSFQVKKYCRMGLGRDRDLACEVGVGLNKYLMVSSAKKQGFKMVESGGDVVAELKQKQLCSGMALGEDVLILEMEPYMDQALVAALVTVYGLINRRL